MWNTNKWEKGTWSKGTIQTAVNGKKSASVDYQVKHYSKGSEWGIDCGKISKLEMRIGGRTIALYDRGWALMPDANDQAAMTAYSAVLHMFN